MDDEGLNRERERGARVSEFWASALDTEAELARYKAFADEVMGQHFLHTAPWCNEQSKAALDSARIRLRMAHRKHLGYTATQPATPRQHAPGANAEDCRACDGRTDLPYPFICDGGDTATTNGGNGA